MSIALESNTRIPPSVFSQAGLPPYCSVLNTTGIIPVVRREAAVADAVAPEDVDRCSSSSSSSIGENSGFSVRSSDNDDGEDNEAESSYRGPLGMESLEEVLPIRRGISNFYNGKSKSFTSLADASSSSSIKEIAKPENAFSRKRRNLLASNLIAGGISKRPIISSSRSSLALAVVLSSSESHKNNDLNSIIPPPTPIRPPLHPNGRASRINSGSAVPSLCKFPTWRSYSMANIQ
ncbi:Damaged dna-binding 2, putative isoform 1 [Cucumis melo var. makuwa]|nr:Damaged dna-binding 2, putative isoform 1 [Cucumis melo var. makuwa]TYK00723.1 Damaged dna-binding 2, putative isoform 1 [Cucumis melo var. makuwa]